MADLINIPGWATYLRVSDEDKQTPERSFAMQRQRILEHLIAGSDIPFGSEYRDMLTGTSPNRADYQKLMADAEARKFSHLGLYRADRFGRDTVEGLQAATKLIGWGIKIRVAHMPSLMPETPDGFFMFLLQMGMAQREVDVLRQRTSDGMEVKLRAGGWAYKAPEGYINKEKLVSSNKYDRWVEQNPETISMIREAFDMLLTDRFTLVEICEELSTRGYSRTCGLPWAWNDPKTGRRMAAKNRLSSVFHNPFYAGWVVSERLGIKKGEIRGTWDPIISNEEFQCGLEILSKHDLDKARDRRYFYLLKGLLWMEIDRAQYKMTGSSPVVRNHLYPYYTTQSKPNGKDAHISCSSVDEQIPALLSSISVDLEKLPRIREAYKAQLKQFKDSENVNQVEKLQAQLSQLKNEESRLGRLFITGKISEESYNQLRLEWQDNIRKIEVRIAECERNSNLMIMDLDLALTLLTKIQEIFPRLDEKEKSYLLKILLKRIIINPEGIIIGQLLNSPFTYLKSLSNDLENHSGTIIGCSEQVPSGALSFLNFTPCQNRLFPVLYEQETSGCPPHPDVSCFLIQKPGHFDRVDMLVFHFQFSSSACGVRTHKKSTCPSSTSLARAARMGTFSSNPMSLR